MNLGDNTLAGSSQTIGLIAGNQSLPLRAAKRIVERGYRLVVVGLSLETDPLVYELASAHIEISLGQLGAMGDFFVSHKVDSICLVGGISRDNIINSYVPDEAAIAVMESLPNFQTNTILGGLADYLESRGPKVVSVAALLPELLVQPGLLTKVTPKPELLADLKLAFTLAKELGRLDCGQTVVVSDLIAVALEGADGTDATIKRGALLSKKRVAVAKVVKPKQDLRLDLPVIGLQTIDVLVEANAGALALDASGLIMLDQEKCLAKAESSNLAIIAWDSITWADKLGQDAVLGFRQNETELEQKKEKEKAQEKNKEKDTKIKTEAEAPRGVDSEVKSQSDTTRKPATVGISPRNTKAD